MRALRYERYGSPDVLHVGERPEPSPAAGHVKIRVRAVGLNPLDWKILAGHLRFVPLFRPPPRGVGLDFAGDIVSVAGGAIPRHVGERVFGSLAAFGRQGACSEYVTAPCDRTLPLPAEVEDVQAAALPIAGGTALQALTDEVQVVAKQRVLIIGAAGGVGHFALQIAKHLGAHVVAVCGARNVDFVRAVGADEVIDYSKDDFTRRQERFDVVFDAACASSFGASKRVLTESGCYISTSGDAASSISTMAGAVLARLTSHQQAIALRLRNGPLIWQRLLDLARAGTLRAHVERVVSMEEVAGAFRVMETGHGRGKVVVRLP